MRAIVIALADLGRCARMQYHALALADRGVEVHFVGLEGTPLPLAVAEHDHITVHRLRPATSRFRPGAALVYAGFASGDATRLAFRLWRCLRALPKADLVLVQNPPAFPTLEVARLALRRRGVRFIVDWHNLGYSLLQRRLGRWHPAVRVARWFERRHAQRVDASLAVSRGMAGFLQHKFNATRVQVLHDRPAAVFAPMDRAVRDRFRQGFFGRMGVVGGPTGFVVCPSSWTEDEDFDVVIDAVLRLEERVRGWEASGSGRRRFPQLIILVTGDGRRRVEFERRFAGLPARRIHLRARWLEPDEYPRVVGSADLGLCLHRSTSGLDIPMKVADLFGAGVPVCALDYGACLAERVRHGDSGLLFSTDQQLADILFDLFEAYPGDQSALERLRQGVRRAARPTWEEGWIKEAQELLVGR